MGSFRAIVSLSLFLLSIVVLGPFQAIIVACRIRPLYNVIPLLFHRFVTRILFGMRITVIGKPAKASKRKGPVLIAANHNSWMDITVLSAVTPVSFVAKAEVATWPLFGWLAKLQRTIFVKRDARAQTAHQTAELLKRLERGDRLVLFPEGTSSNGNTVLPFNSSLFGVAQLAEMKPGMKSLRVQPVSVSYQKVHGLPMGRYYRPFYAWYGEMELAPHLWRGLQLGPIDVVVEFHDPITLADTGNRKKLALLARNRVAKGMERALVNRSDV